MKSHLLEVGFLVIGTLFGLIVSIPGNLWSTTYMEIVLNGRTDLWVLLGLWTLGLIALGFEYICEKDGLLFLRKRK